MADINSTDHRTFNPFRWACIEKPGIGVDVRTLLNFADKVNAVSHGSSVILKMAEEIDLAIDTDETALPYLNRYYMGALMRMVECNMQMLADESERLNDLVRETYTPGGRASRFVEAANAIRANGESLPNL